MMTDEDFKGMKDKIDKIPVIEERLHAIHGTIEKIDATIRPLVTTVSAHNASIKMLHQDTTFLKRVIYSFSGITAVITGLVVIFKELL